MQIRQSFRKSHNTGLRNFIERSAPRIVPRIAKFHRKNHQALRPNANSPLRVYDSKGWYCAAATACREAYGPALLPAAATSAIVASKQGKWDKEKIGLFLTKARIEKFPGTQ